MVEEYTEVKDTTKILIIEDSDYDFELVERKLRKMNFLYNIKRASCGREYEDLLINFIPDLILSDFSIPSYSGLKALEFAKLVQPEVPFIFVSGSIGEERAVEALKLGADDYVLKDNLNKLEPSVYRALAEAEEKKKRKEAEKKLKIKNKELRDLVYRISHDFKGPICTIQGAINLSKIAAGRDENLIYVNAIEQVTKKLDGVVKNLSNFQHVFADEVKLSSINLETIIGEAVNSVSLSLTEEFNQINLSVKISGEKVSITEKSFLYSMLYNLIHNAVVFSDKSKAVKTINCILNNNDRGICLIIEDNGSGIPEIAQSRACEMFYRGSSVSKGAGLGLYIVKTCTDLLNGKLEILSSEGKGTKVSVYLPHPKPDKNGIS